MSELVRNGVALADDLLGSFGLKARVKHYPWKSGTLWSEREYGSPVTVQCVVAFKVKMFRTGDGEERTSSMTLTFTKPMAIDLRDKFEIPKVADQPARTSEILSIEGAMDPLTGRPYAPTVYLA